MDIYFRCNFRNSTEFQLYVRSPVELCLGCELDSYSSESASIFGTVRKTLALISLKQLANAFDEIGTDTTPFQLQRCTKEVKEDHEKNGGFEFLAKHEKGVWVVLLH